MNCNKCNDISLSLSFNEECNETLFAEFANHIAKCPECKTQHEANMQIVSLIQEDVTQPNSAYPLLRIAAVLITTITAAIAFIILTRSISVTDEWAFVGLDAANSRSLPNLKVIPTEMAWRHQLHNSGGYAKPLVRKDIVIVTVREMQSGSTFIEAYETTSGELRWKVPFNAGTPNKTKGFQDRFIRGNKLYISNGENCAIHDFATGKTVGILNSPMEAVGWGYLSADNQGNIVGASADGKKLFLLSSKNHSVKWVIDANISAGQPAIAKNSVYYCTDDHNLISTDIKTGLVLWRKKISAAGTVSKIIVNRESGIALTDLNETFSFNTRNGNIKWDKEISGIYNSGIALGQDTIYIDGGKRSISLLTGTENLRHITNTQVSCSPPLLAGKELIESSKLSSVVAACEGIIMAGKQFFTVSGGHLIAFNADAIKQ